MAIDVSIEPQVLKKFPDARVFAVRAAGLQEKLTIATSKEMLRKTVEAYSASLENITDDSIVMSWRKAYQDIGLKPSKYRSSIESLLRRAAKNLDISLPIPAVNIYNECSIRAKAPLGAYDADALPAVSLALRFARPGTDTFDPLGAEPTAFPIKEGIVVYAAEDEVMCWGFNCRDSKRAALSTTTSNAVFFSEAVYEEQRLAAEAALGMLIECLRPLGVDCGNIVIGSAERPNFTL